MKGTVVITIGRNVEKYPMHEKMWEDFIRRTRVLFEEEYVASRGKGYWQLTEEDNFTIVGRCDMMKEDFESTISELAARFKQDAIAVTYGTTVLVGPYLKGE